MPDPTSDSHLDLPASGREIADPPPGFTQCDEGPRPYPGQARLGCACVQLHCGAGSPRYGAPLVRLGDFSMRRMLLALALGLAPLADARRRPAGRARAPLSELVRQVDIPYQQFTLPNGLRVWSTRTARRRWSRSRSGIISARRTSPRARPASRICSSTSCSTAREHAPGDFFEPLQQIGATDMNGTTWFDRTNYFETVPTGALDRALFLESRPDGPPARRGHPEEARYPARRRPEREAAGRQPAFRPRSNIPSSTRCSPPVTPIITRRSARWPTSTPPASRT